MRRIYNISIKLSEGNQKIKKDKGKYKIHENNCEYKQGAYWVGSIAGWQIGDEELKNIGLGNTLSLDKSTIKGKKFYRHPDLNLPRTKVDLLKDKYNIKVTRKKENADFEIVSKKGIQKMVTKVWDKHYNKRLLYKYLVKLKDDDMLSDCALNWFRKLLQDTEQDAMFCVEVNRYYYSSDHLSKAQEDFVQDVSNQTNDIFSGNDSSLVVGLDTNVKARANDPQLFVEMVAANNLVLDETMIDIIDEGLAVIDNDRYSEIEKMIQSSNIDDRSLAVEMLANCNVNKSFDVVSGIYYWHYDWFKNSNNWNTVNVKAFRTQMENYQGGHCTGQIWSYNNYIKKLADDGKLTKFAVDKTRQLVLDKLLCKEVGPSSECFKVDLSNLVLSDKYKDYMTDE